MRKRIKSLPFEFWILLLAAIPRFWGIANGLPDTMNPDENMLIRRALRFGSGDLNPHFFYYPSFSIYLFFIFDVLYFILGRFIGIFHSTNDLARVFFTDPTPFYFIARSLIALSDMFSAIVIFHLGKRLFSKETGAFAAFLWCFFPQGLVESQVGKPDALMVFLALLALLFLLAIKNEKTFFISGFLLGLSISSKYQSVIIAPIACFWIASKSQAFINNCRNIGIFLLSMGIGFFVGTPFSVFDFSSFQKDFFSQAAVMRMGMFGAEGGSRGWFIYLKGLLLPGGSIVFGILGLAGIISAICEKGKEKIILSGIIALLFLTLGFQRISSLHYFYLGYSILFLFIGWEFFKLNRKVSKKITVLIFVLGFFPFLSGILGHMRKLSGIDTRVACRVWIEENIPSGSTLLIDASTPQLRMTDEQLDTLYNKAKTVGHIKADYFLMVKKFSRRPSYKIFLTEQPVMLSPKDLVNHSRLVQDLIPIDMEIDWIKNQGVQYAILSSTEWDQYNNESINPSYPKHANFYKQILKRDMLAEFNPGNSKSGPTIKIFKL